MEFSDILALLQNGINFSTVQCASLGWLISLASASCDKDPKGVLVLITAVHAGGVLGDTGGLAAWRLVKEGANIEVSAHGLVGSEGLAWDLAFGADEPVKEFLCVSLINANARAVVPILTTSLAENHHAMIIRATADAVFSAIIGLVAGRDTGFGTRGLASLTRAGWGARFDCESKTLVN
jgi:hypothetical protein